MMTRDERLVLLGWLRGNCEGDAGLLELIDVLDNEGEDDLLLLMRDYRHPNRTEAEIAARAGSEDAVERQLIRLHQRFVPIARRGDPDARAREFYQRISAKENMEPIVEDPGWSLKPEERQPLRALVAETRQRPPVPYEELPIRLNTTEDDVRTLIQTLHDRHLQWRRAREEARQQGRDKQ
jgi:hypothetical protein